MYLINNTVIITFRVESEYLLYDNAKLLTQSYKNQILQHILVGYIIICI